MQRPRPDLQQEREPRDPGARVHARRRHRCGSHLPARREARRSEVPERLHLGRRHLAGRGVRRGLALLPRGHAALPRRHVPQPAFWPRHELPPERQAGVRGPVERGRAHGGRAVVHGARRGGERGRVGGRRVRGARAGRAQRNRRGALHRAAARARRRRQRAERGGGAGLPALRAAGARADRREQPEGAGRAELQQPAAAAQRGDRRGRLHAVRAADLPAARAEGAAGPAGEVAVAERGQGARGDEADGDRELPRAGERGAGAERVLGLLELHDRRWARRERVRRRSAEAARAAHRTSGQERVRSDVVAELPLLRHVRADW